jgi:hypothetical protein
MMELNFIVESLELQVGTEAVRWLLNLKNFPQLGLISSYIYSEFNLEYFTCTF